MKAQWIKIARGRFSSAAGKRAKDENLESPRCKRGAICWVGRYREAVPGPKQQLGTGMVEDGQHEQPAGWSNPKVRKGQRWTIATWSNHKLGKAESKVLQLNTAGERLMQQYFICLDKLAQHLCQTVGRLKDYQIRASFLGGQEIERGDVDLEYNNDSQCSKTLCQICYRNIHQRALALWITEP